ncbi:hypothetical protein QBZ16_001545 [Prototheca wickerhamii]|uniref:HIRAN domain-containing protein n=1 Tax=Prototheca wickerhamii TaxID=3111 RepID=A0AAD9IEV5_PROWI|nr:hypothetical protein QBZ16_001545 [Prototheca wickerhamii]
MLQFQRPFEAFKAVGVSFNDVQTTLGTMNQGDALIIAREPDNPYDREAVRILSLDGRPLGYVARTDTHHFTRRQVTGRIASLGQAQQGSGLLGYRIECQPAIRCVALTAAPAPLLPWLDLAQRLQDGPGWDALLRRELAPGTRCHLSGAPATHLVADWDISDASRCMRLSAFLPATQAIAAIVTSPSLRIRALEALAALNYWGLEEAEIYHRAHMFQVAQRGAEAAWTVDVELLRGLDLPVPEGLSV